jgi:3-dehydroquinate synthase
MAPLDRSLGYRFNKRGRKTMRTHLHYVKSLRRLRLSNETSIVIYDRRLLHLVPGFRRWISSFPYAFSVTAGEKLKSLTAFEKMAELVHRRVGQDLTRSWTVVAVGGGSVGDFAGFFASVYRRGLRLVHVPTTWLAAIDSSHGGKTALNLRGVKNQIGTFYPATDTYLVQSLLRALPTEAVDDAVGELAKIALIDGGAWTRNLRRPKAASTWLWKTLPFAIASKLRVVRRDPGETKGPRQLLNLGHTFGHVIEAELGFSHGRSVALGLLFAIDVSECLGTLTAVRATELRSWLGRVGILRDSKRRDRVNRSRAVRLLRSDKKRDEGDFVWFLVIRGFGRVERRLIEIQQLIEVADAKGWLR